MKVLSLFDGMSCGQIALNKAGIKYDTYYASEIDKHAIKITQKNYPNTIQLGDITKIDLESLPKIDLLIGGSPCQGFSFAGKQLAFNDPRSMLFFEFVKIKDYLQKKNPDLLFLLENVRMKSEHEQVISRFMGIDPVEINSALVSAQNRVRLYWTNIGAKRDGLFDFLYPGIEQPKDKGLVLKDILESDADSVTLTERRSIEAKQIRKKVKQETGKDFSPRRAKELVPRLDKELVPRLDKKSNCLTANMSLEHLVKIKEYVDRDKAHCLDANYGKGTNLDNYLKKNRRQVVFLGMSIDQKSRTLRTSGKGSWSEKHNNDIINIDGAFRMLTPIECERLQTVPDNYTEGVPKTQRYKMLGNGWTVDVIAHIFSYLK